MNQVDKFLKMWTGEPSSYWMAKIGHLIHDHSKPIKGSKGLSYTETHKWLAVLSKRVALAVRQRLFPTSDENIGVSKVLSVILLLWYARIVRAKCYDPRRPKNARKSGLGSLVNFAKVITVCLMDESNDHRYFPSQEWDSPFPPGARYEPDDMELKRQAYGKKVKRRKP